MSSDKHVIRFIEDFILKNDLRINVVPETTPMHLSLVEHFEANGWTKAPVEDQPKRFQMFNPDGVFTVNVRGISATRHPAVTSKICRSKHHTKKFLNLGGVSTPLGAEFQRDEEKIATEFFSKMPKPVVVKPTNAASSQGVSIDIASVDEFEKAWAVAIEQSNENSRVLVEEHVEGLEIRAFVIDQNVVSAAVRLPPFVVGNGDSTVAELIEVNREERKRNRKVRTLFEADWDFIKLDGYSESSVPPPGKVVLLHPFKTTGFGGLFFDITDELHEDIKKLAVESVNSIPHLEMAGVDILTEDISNGDTATIIEINTTPAPDVHRYPAYGRSQPLAERIVDYYHQEFLREKSHDRNASLEK